MEELTRKGIDAAVESAKSVKIRDIRDDEIFARDKARLIKSVYRRAEEALVKYSYNISNIKRGMTK